ncbi:hypothetical protein JCM24511_02373 [Saitozyma sp. JCM 24511]|nr:hypothetical protein JCM24511_02373 [Saitozyma sp. JCM 24511]
MSFRDDIKAGPEADHAENIKSDDPPEGTTKGVHNALLYEAVQESQLGRWSPSAIRIYFAIFVAFCCAVANGYDSSLLAGMLPMEYFQNAFHTGTSGPKVSLIACLYTVGHIVGSPIGAVISDKYGRRWTMFCGCWIVILGMVIVVASKSLAAFAVGRFVLGLGITLSTLAAPAYAMEISPPHWRGRATGLYNCGWFGGSIPAAAVTFGCNYIKNDYSWRIPLILQACGAMVVICSVFFIPESPRFLMANGKEQEALDFLVKYHGGGDRNSKLVALEYAEFKEGISQTGSDKRWWDYRCLVKTRNARWRSAQVIMMGVAGQYSGNGLAYFNTVIYQKLGIKAVTEQLGYNLLYAFISALGALCGAILSDRMPRRKVLVFGTLACAGWLAINAGLQSAMATHAEPVPPALSKGALAAYLLFNFNFMFCYTPLQAVIPAEALETTIRAKGFALLNITTGAMGFLNQFCGPIALGNIGYQYVYVFVAWDVVEAGLWYCFGVEGQGRTLEELEWVYDQPNPVKASLSKQRVVVGPEGGVRAMDDI